MASSLFLYFKVPETDQVIQVDVTSMLIGGETITNAVIGTVQPTTTPAFVATLQTSTVPPIDPQLQILLQGGENGVSYGFNITITTTARVFLVTAGVT
jgi:hypothetical protein